MVIGMSAQLRSVIVAMVSICVADDVVSGTKQAS
jgi:hypothetical protein